MPNPDDYNHDLQKMKDFMSQQVEGLAAGKGKGAGAMATAFGAITQQGAVVLKIRGKELTIPDRGFARGMSIALAGLYALEDPKVDAILEACDLRWEAADGSLIPLFGPTEEQMEAKMAKLAALSKEIDKEEAKQKAQGPAKKKSLLLDEEEPEGFANGQRVLCLPNEHFKEHRFGTIDGKQLPGEEARYLVMVEESPFQSTKYNITAVHLQAITTPEELTEAEKLVSGS